MRNGPLANLLRWIAQRTEFVLLVLKQIGIDRAGRDAIFALEAMHRFRIRHSIRQVPKDVQSKRWRDASQLVHLARVAEFLF